MKIGLSFDLKDAVAPLAPGQAESSGKSSAPEDAFEEYDAVETINALQKAIEAGGHSVVRLGGGRDFLNRVLREKVDFVFNISEGLGCYRSREAQVPSVLEMLDIPYSGADPQCLAVCLDKGLAKKIVALEGVKTPAWRVVSCVPGPEMDWKALPYPAFVKPLWEGSSKGIRLKSLVQGPQEMEKLVPELLDVYRQPVLIEEFIKGDEVTVGMLGNSPPRVMGIMRIKPRNKEENFVYSLEVKRDYERLVEYECPAVLKPETIRLINEYSQKTFEVLGCRDFARVDFRIDADGTPCFLEINPLAGLNPRSSDIIIMAGLIGLKYNDVIGSILDAALKRNSLCC